MNKIMIDIKRNVNTTYVLTYVLKKLYGKQKCISQLVDFYCMKIP